MHQSHYYRFEIYGRFYYSRQIFFVYERWRIQFEDVPWCIGGESYKQHNLPHTTNYVSTRFFFTCITSCMQGKSFGLQVRGWQRHNHHVCCNSPKNYHEFCYVDEEEFTFLKSTYKFPKSCWIETTQDVDTYQNTMGKFYYRSTMSYWKLCIYWLHVWSNVRCRFQYQEMAHKVDGFLVFHHGSPHYESNWQVH